MNLRFPHVRFTHLKFRHPQFLSLNFARPVLLSFFLVSFACGQTEPLNPDSPKPGTQAPPLVFTQLLQSPAGAKTDWPSLHGKVVILEFWATWCVPCLAEIPVLNSLSASLDPAKFQIISVDDEDPAVVQAFLKKRPIAGWIGLDTSGKLYPRYGVEARPATMVIDPEGRVASTTARPETLQTAQLVALSEGKPVVLGGKADPKVEAQLNAAIAKGFAEEMNISPSSSEKSLFQINLTAANPPADGTAPKTHVMMLGDGKLTIVYASPSVLLSSALEIPSSRITATGDLSKLFYNLQIEAPGADPKQLASAVELAITSGAHIHIERRSTPTDVYLLTAVPSAKDHLAATSDTGFAAYDSKSQRMKCIDASTRNIAAALERAFGMPVIDESGLSGKANATVPIAPKDLAATKEALEKQLGLTLTPGRRPVETFVLSPMQEPAKPPQTPAN